ncbi:hypothetical protein PENTCL1PPCAC_26600, partial [Pristionchus entomophagus]
SILVINRMDSPEVLDDTGFASFFLDYKHPSLINSAYTINPASLSLDIKPFITPPTSVTSTTSSSNLSVFSSSLTPAQTTRTLVIKRKLFDNNQEALKAAIASITSDESIDLEEIENFAVNFKKQRMAYGCTQHDIGMALGRKYGTEFSQTTISRFEALNLSFKNMCKLRPLIRDWLADVDSALDQGLSINEFLQRTPSVSLQKPVNAKSKKAGGFRKKRTFIDGYQSVKLQEEFDKNCRPTGNQLNDLAERLQLDKNIIRVWYSNHRQKIRKIEDERITLQMNGDLL